MISIRMISGCSVGSADFAEGQEYLVSVDTLNALAGCYIRTDCKIKRLEEMDAVLICKSNGLGNVINITPMIKKLKLINPDIKIDILCLTPYKPIFSAMSQVRNVYDDTEIREALQDWDIIINGIPASFPLTGLPRDKIITGENEWYKTMHEVEANIKILETVTDNIDHVPDTFITIPEDIKKKVDELLRDGKYIGINAGYSKNQEYWKIKHWGDKNYAELVEKLISEYPCYKIVAFGITGEDGFLEGRENNDDRVMSLCGKLSILETAQALSKMEFVVSNDSGNAHLASAMGVQSFVIFGPTSEVKNKPWGKSTAIVKDIPCRPCQFKKGWHECKEIKCLEITPEEVIKTIKEEVRYEIGVVVNSYKRYDYISAFLNLMIGWKGLQGIKLVLIDDFSEDERINKAVESFRIPFEAKGNKLDFIKHEMNYGKEFFPRSIQEGIDHSSDCNLILFASEDLVCNPNILNIVRANAHLMGNGIECLSFFMDTRSDKSTYADKGRYNDEFHNVEWADGFLTCYREAFLSRVKIFGMPSEMGSGVWFCVNKYISNANLRQLRYNTSLCEHTGNVKSTMNDDWRKYNPIDGINLNMWEKR